MDHGKRMGRLLAELKGSMPLRGLIVECDGTRVVVKCRNGYGVSIIHDGDLWELAVQVQQGGTWRTTYASNITDDVLRKLDTAQVVYIVGRIADGRFVPERREFTEWMEIPGYRPNTWGSVRKNEVRTEPKEVPIGGVCRTYSVRVDELIPGDMIVKVLTVGFAVVNPNRV